MNQEHQSEASQNRGGPASAPARKWLKGLALLAVGVILGTGGHALWNTGQDHQRITHARQQADALFLSLAPQAELKLGFLAKQIDELDAELTEAGNAITSVAIPLTHLRAQQKRLQLQADQAQQFFGRLTAFVEQAPDQFHLAADRPVLSATQRQQLDELRNQSERVRQGLEAIASGIDLAKELRLQLAALEAEATRRARVVTEIFPQRVQADPFQTAPVGVVQFAQAEGIQRLPAQPVQDTWQQPAATVPTVIAEPRAVSVPPAVRYVSAPLVIGSSYPDRFIGYRDWVRYSYYAPYSYAPYGYSAPRPYPLRLHHSVW